MTAGRHISRPVKIRIKPLGALRLRIISARAVHKPVMFRAVIADHKAEPFLIARIVEFRHIIPAVKFHHIPAVQIACVQFYAVMVLAHRHNIACSAGFKKFGPFRGIKLIRPESFNKIPVFKIHAVCFGMVKIARIAFYVHSARIPFVAERGNGIHAPVNKDAESFLTQKRRRFKLRKAFPVILKFAVFYYLINLFKVFVYFAHRKRPQFMLSLPRSYLFLRPNAALCADPLCRHAGSCRYAAEMPCAEKIPKGFPGFEA